MNGESSQLSFSYNIRESKAFLKPLPRLPHRNAHLPRKPYMTSPDAIYVEVERAAQRHWRAIDRIAFSAILFAYTCFEELSIPFAQSRVCALVQH